MSSQHSNTTMYALLVAIGGFLFGFDASVISGVIRFVTIEWNLTPLQQGLVVAAPTFAAIISSLVAAPISDRIGRKPVLIALGVIYIISAVYSALATDYQNLVIARMIGGFAFASLGIAPIYIAEISPAAKRGMMVSFNQMNIVIGFAASYFANYFLLQLSQSSYSFVSTLGIDTDVWRWMLGLELLPAMLFLAGALIIPESPRWLIKNNKQEQANAVLKKLMSSDQIEQKVAEIKATLKDTKQSVIKQIPDLFGKRLRLPIVIGLIVGIAQQITGINAIYFYAPSIFEQTGVGTNAAFAQTALLGVTNVVCTIFAMYFIDRLGRKPLLLAGLTGVFITMLTVSYSFHKAEYIIDQKAITSFSQELKQDIDLSPLVGKVHNSDVEFKTSVRSVIGDDNYRKHESEILSKSTNINAVLIMIAIIGFTASFAISLGPVMWVLFSEIFPNRSRGLCNGLVGFFNALTSYLVTQIFPWQLDTMGASQTFMIYGLLCVVSFALILWLLPETKGKSIEELEKVMCKD